MAYFMAASARWSVRRLVGGRCSVSFTLLLALRGLVELGRGRDAVPLTWVMSQRFGSSPSALNACRGGEIPATSRTHDARGGMRGRCVRSWLQQHAGVIDAQAEDRLGRRRR